MKKIKDTRTRWQRFVGAVIGAWPYPRPDLDAEFDAGYRLGLSVGAREGQAQGRREVVQVLITPETTTDVLGPLVLDLHMPAEDIVGHLVTGEVPR